MNSTLMNGYIEYLKNVMVDVGSNQLKQEPITNTTTTQDDVNGRTLFAGGGFPDGWMTNAEDPRAESGRE